jgi:pyruvate kinase
MDYEQQALEAINRMRSLNLQDAHIFADFQGVKMRLQLEPGQNNLKYHIDDVLYIYTDHFHYPFISNYETIADFVRPGFKISFADNKIEAIIRRVDLTGIEIKFVRVDYVLRQNAGCYIEGEGMPTPYMTKKVCSAIARSEVIQQKKIDWVILSFMENADEIIDFVSNMHQLGIKVMAKIETGNGVNNIHKIASVVDGFMIGRGDLKTTTKDAYDSFYNQALEKIKQHKDLYIGVGTFFLSNYSQTNVISKEEISDIENVKLNGFDYIMLSKEVVNSNYPYETIKLLQNLCHSL